MIDASFTLIDVAFEVCTALDAAGIHAVLTGGSAATFYAPEAYQSADADFVLRLRLSSDPGVVLATMRHLGFVNEGGSHVHPSSRYFVEFPPGPLQIGDELVKVHATTRRDVQVLHVLTPTDSVRDRLMAYLAWNDRSSLATALAVAHAQRTAIDFSAIDAWVQREAVGPFGQGFEEKYALFKSAVDDRR